MVRKDTPTTVYWLDNKLYLNITNKCSNNCFFCLRNYRTGVGDFNLKLTQEPPATTVIADIQNAPRANRWAEIIFCGFGEPTERLDLLLDISRWLRQHYTQSLPIRVNTNGHGNMLNPQRPVPKELKAAGVTKISVSLNAQNESVYNEICRPKIENAYNAVLEFINQAKQELETEVTAVTTPEVDLQKIEKTAQEIGVKLRIRPYIPCFC
jgi:cyclic pyranopterin phosphate synthase